MTLRTTLRARGMFAIGAIAGILLVAGCGGGDDSSAEPTTLDPQEVISQASPGVVEIYGKYGDTAVGGSGLSMTPARRSACSPTRT